MTAAHKVSAVRESISIVEKRQQYFDICDCISMYMPFLEMNGLAMLFKALQLY